MHLHIHPSSCHDAALIVINDEEVPLFLYWYIVDLSNAGHTVDSIVVHVAASTTMWNIKALEPVVHNIINNEDLILREFQSQSHSSVTLALAPNLGDTRRNPRIIDVSEFDVLDVTNMVATQKVKERAGLLSLLAKLG